MAAMGGDEPVRRGRSIEDAVAQARMEERINAQLKAHDTEIRELRANQVETTHSLTEMRLQLTRVERTIAEQAAVARAVADAAAKGLTQRQLYIALGMFLVALIGLLLGVGANHV